MKKYEITWDTIESTSVTNLDSIEEVSKKLEIEKPHLIKGLNKMYGQNGWRLINAVKVNDNQITLFFQREINY